MNTVPVWVNLLNPVRRLADSADCNQHRARLCANGGFWRKAAIVNIGCVRCETRYEIEMISRF
jgi:hypothetical protein